MTDQKNLTPEDFGPLEGQVVTLSGEGSQIEAKLVEIKPLGNALREGGGFALLFQGPATPGLAQATYQVSHASLGTHDLFLVPVAKTEAGYQYEAVFT